MSAFQNPNFIKEFAYRTKLNYYLLKCQQSDLEDAKRYEMLIAELHQEMEQQHFVKADFYEVTQLLNSMIGLLVFPETNGYKQIPNDKNDFSKFPTLKSYVDSEAFSSNYQLKRKRDGKEYYCIEPVTPRTVIRHLRNAVCHERISVFPTQCTMEDGDSIISGIKFIDEESKQIKQTDKVLKNNHFEITIESKNLEMLLIELCDTMIEAAR